ncbi:MAG: SLBB domain-containing protein [Nitrospirae bacterium]|nr:SLBB domain-containing protein [Nitrospirota bacterium]
MKNQGKNIFPIYFSLLIIFIPLNLYAANLFSIQVGAFSLEKNAMNQVEYLKTHGIRCIINKVRGMNTVNCGEFTSQTDASDLKMRLYYLGYKDTMIVSLPDKQSNQSISAQPPQHDVTDKKEDVKEDLENLIEKTEEVTQTERIDIKDIPVPAVSDYLVGSQDVLRISVYEHPDLTTTVRVSEDGKITFPLVGELEIKNLTVQQIEKKIAKRLSDGIIPNPQVTVFVEQFKGARVTVIGEVAKPGQYEITGPTTVIEAISMAFGMTENAGHTIMLFKRVSEKENDPEYQKVAIDVDRLFKEGDLSLNFQLQNGDIIYVPKIDFFYIYGEVNRPGIYRLEKGLTVKRAISVAGGFTPKAAKGRIEITRRQDGKDIVKKADINELVRPDDTIMVKESIF